MTRSAKMPTAPSHNEMPYRPLGDTGENVSAIGLGGSHIGLEHVDDALSLRLIR